MHAQWRVTVPLVVVMVICLLGSVSQASPLPVQPVLWLKADEGVEVEDSFVIRWLDQSGHEHHAVADPDSEPELVYGVIAGQPVIRFNGKNTYLRVPHADRLNATNGLSVFVVYYYEGGFRLVQKKSGAAGLEPDAWMIPPRNGLGVAGAWTRDVLFSPGEDHLMASVYDADAGTIKIYRNGTHVATVEDVPQPVANADDLYIGKRHYPAGTEGSLDGDIAEFIVFDVALTDAERAAVEAYLSEKYRF